MKKKIYLLLLFTTFSMFSQQYIALDTADYAQRKLLVEKIDYNFKNFEKQLRKKYKGKIRKEIQKSYLGLHDDFKKIVKKKELIFESKFSQYIDSLTHIISKNNSHLITNDIKVFVTKHNSPNALSLGNGYILINMGLFKYLKNEGQIVSVMSHEIAHQLLRHSEKNIISRATSETSKSKQIKIKKLKKNKYNKQSTAFKELKKILYSNSKTNRQQEKEADSLGFILYNNTNYQPKDFINTLKIISKLDSLPNIVLDSTTYYTFFNLPNQPFNKNWLKIENFNAYNYDHFKNKINKDSLKSHPEMLQRISHLEKIFEKELSSQKESLDKTSFNSYKKIANYEDVANLFYDQKYGLSIYLSLYKLSISPNNNYYKEWLGTNFHAIYNAKKKYRFNRYVDRLIPKEQDKSYQQFLSFLWNLKLQEIEKIANHYKPKDIKKGEE
ncbi:M48 family metallopeptidase [uncultured Tenacibaculum sp.]|uniref:M48 family metallopeptidase n=1 Tax=uncultured Tenacibaculum sp. TaxID=174713 RepID=UPI00261CE262|nr:M48 family metallopeptidase [uncultured Tenacibaculum sp.]